MSVNSPMITIRIEMTIATIGRRMKNSRHDYPPPFGLPGDAGALPGGRPARSPAPPAAVDFCSTFTCMPGRTFCMPSTMTRSPALRPLDTMVEVAHALVQDHGPELHLVLRAHHEDDLGSLLLLHGHLRHEHGVRPGIHHAAHARELAGSQLSRRVGELGLHGNRARLHIEGPAHEDEAALLREQAIVGEVQLEPALLLLSAPLLIELESARRASGSRPRRRGTRRRWDRRQRSWRAAWARSCPRGFPDPPGSCR